MLFFPCVLEFSNTISVLQCMVVGCPLHLEEGESWSQVGTLFEFQVSSLIWLATFATTILLFGSNSCMCRAPRSGDFVAMRHMMECGSVAQPRFGCIPAHDPFLGKFLPLSCDDEATPPPHVGLF